MAILIDVLAAQASVPITQSEAAMREGKILRMSGYFTVSLLL
jgi:hypothetical protein